MLMPMLTINDCACAADRCFEPPFSAFSFCSLFSLPSPLAFWALSVCVFPSAGWLAGGPPKYSKTRQGFRSPNPNPITPKAPPIPYFIPCVYYVMKTCVHYRLARQPDPVLPSSFVPVICAIITCCRYIQPSYRLEHMLRTLKDAGKKLFSESEYRSHFAADAKETGEIGMSTWAKLICPFFASI